MTGGRITATGGEELIAAAGDKTQQVDLKGRRAVPGLNDSHMHVIRGGPSYWRQGGGKGTLVTGGKCGKGTLVTSLSCCPALVAARGRWSLR